MLKEEIKDIFLETYDISSDKDEMFEKIIIKDLVLKKLVRLYVKQLDDYEIFFEKGNCIVTNKGYHFAIREPKNEESSITL